MSITNFQVNGKCSNCGKCCTDFAIISHKEVRIIKEYIKEHNIKECNGSIIDGNKVPMYCPFRDEEKRVCNIYPVRPYICRGFNCDMTEDQVKKHKKVKGHYYNLDAVNVISWHVLFYKNYLQQNQYQLEMEYIRTLFRR